MAFKSGDYVKPKRQWAAKWTSAKNEDGDNEGPELLDWNNYRTGIGRVVSVAVATSVTQEHWDPDTSQMVSITKTETIYNVEIWAIDVTFFAGDTYPESELEEYVGQGSCTAIHYDESSIASLKEAEKIAP